ncbi:MAG: hypothetical protein IKX97_05225, partial [Erysipelotrichaceae bacterium]|nr:hypothetical protein [Erysipelotrichaceae bacterium]
MYYQIRNTLVETDDRKRKPYLAVFTSDEWEKVKDEYPFHLETDELYDLNSTNADVHLHSLSGSFSIPDRNDLNSDDMTFRFALNEDCVIFIDDTGYVNDVLSYIIQTKKWNSPGIGRAVYDFLDYIVKDDVSLMEK